LESVTLALNQSMQQLTELMASVSQGLCSNAETIAQIVQQQSQPKQISLSDGRTIVMEPLTQQ